MNGQQQILLVVVNLHSKNLSLLKEFPQNDGLLPTQVSTFMTLEIISVPTFLWRAHSFSSSSIQHSSVCIVHYTTVSKAHHFLGTSLFSLHPEQLNALHGSRLPIRLNIFVMCRADQLFFILHEDSFLYFRWYPMIRAHS